MSMAFHRRFHAPGVVAPWVTFGDDPRSARIAHEHKALFKSILDIVSSRAELVALGGDPVVQQILSGKGLGACDAVVLSVSVKERVTTVIAVPTRVWREPDRRRAILAAKREAMAAHGRCLIVPQRCVRGNVRAQVARTLAASRAVVFRKGQADAVLDHVRMLRVATLKECAEVVREHQDPYGVVLCLCTQGRLLIDRRTPIGPGSLVASAELAP